MAVTKITGAGLGLPNADGNALGGASNEWSDLYLADSSVIYFGNDQDVTLTHVADTGILLNSTMAIQFNDASQYINAPSNAILDINATDEIELNATLVDINANVEISGTATTTGVHTFTAVPVFPNNTVETADIQADAITGAKIADDAIDSEHYTDGSIDTAHIADNQITLAKMAGGTDGNVISYDASGDPVAIATGSDGQVLTSTGAGSPPAFEDAAGGGAWTLIGTVVASNSATLTVTGLDSTYDTFAIAVSDMVPATDSANLDFRLGDSSGVDSGVSDYRFASTVAVDNSTAYGGTSSTGDSVIRVGGSIGNATGEGAGAMLYVTQPGDATTRPKVVGQWVSISGEPRTRTGATGGQRVAVITVDRVQVLMHSGNITSGRMTVWGIKHA